MKRIAFSAACLLLAAALASPAAADTYSFDNISANNIFDAQAGENQLTVDVVGAGPNKVSFTFHNSGPIAMSITDIYFDDGTLLGIASITDGAGVDFEQGASPGNLPSGNNASPPFVATAGFTADSEPPTQANGVNPGEFVTIVFDLIGGQNIADTIAALADGTLRIGIHVQGFPDGQSESFVNNPPGTPPGPTPVPLPGVASAAIALLAGLGLTRRR